MNRNVGTSDSLSCFQLFSAPTLRRPLAPATMIAESQTFRDWSISPAKALKPGLSRIFSLLP